MTALHHIATLTLLGSVAAPACGPFFADTMLEHPQSALAVPPVSFTRELHLLSGTTPSVDSFRHHRRTGLTHQIPAESGELRSWWEQQGVPEAEIKKRIGRYEAVRRTLLAPIASASLMEFPIPESQPLDLSDRPLGPEFPVDVADYVEGARLHAMGRTGEARTLWTGILERPPEQRRLRAAWAAWMLAKTASDTAECLKWYARAEAEIQGGASDAINLLAGAISWQAGQISDDPVTALRRFHDAFLAGKHSAVGSIRGCCNEIIGSENPEVLKEAAADPRVRQLVNLHLFSVYDGPRQSAIMPREDTPRYCANWLDAMEAHAPQQIPEAARLAWVLYSSGDFRQSRRWLSLCDPSDPLAAWLLAKFELRDGQTDQAGRRLDSIIRELSQQPGWDPMNTSSDLLHGDSEFRHQFRQGRLMADAGVVALARQNYPEAVESFRISGYLKDAFHVAERLMTTDELIAHVRKVAPEWSNSEDYAIVVKPATCLLGSADVSPRGINRDDQLRYILARRLAREGRLEEAREFMPPNLLPLLEHYIALNRARRDGRYTDDAHAAVIWRQALIHRKFGAAMFSTEIAPDGGLYSWSYPMPDPAEARHHRPGWAYEWHEEPGFVTSRDPAHEAIPRVSEDELRRSRRHETDPMKRYHYRYAAADIAWQAGRNLPVNHPSLARLYNTAGMWLANRDPKAADRFYQAMVRRCPDTEEGKRADAKRWFLKDLPPLDDLGALPDAFR